MRALITGGAGFIGSYLSQELIRNSWRVRIYDVQNNRNNPPPVQDKLEYVIGDILDERALTDALKNVDLVIHLAARHRFFGVSEEEFYRVNVDGTRNLLEAMDRTGLKDILFFSSVAVYGEQNTPTDENSPTLPDSTYGVTKLEAEKSIYKWVSLQKERSALIIRPTVVFGPRNRGNMYRLIRQIDRRLFVPVGDGVNVKSTAYVENLIDATLFLIRNGFSGFEVYNYADEPHMQFREIVASIYRLLGRKPPGFSLPAKPVLAIVKPLDVLTRIMGKDFPISAAIKKMNRPTHHSADKIRSIGFRQVLGFEDGLKRMINWYMSSKEV